MKFNRVVLLAAALALAFLLPGFISPAHAQCAGSSYGLEGFPSPGWLGYYGSPYSLGQIPVPPYFALHPPVYYSYPVPRSYGYSPYAYPGTVPTPEVVLPEVIENPYVTPKQEEPAEEKTSVTTASVQVIDNPFVRPELRTRSATRFAAMRPLP